MADNRDHSNDIRLSPLEKDGEALLAALDQGRMAAILSEKDLMYIFRQDGNYLCYLHTMDEEEGRARAFPGDDAHRAMIKNLAELGDLLFEAEYRPNMERMGIIFTAEQGIIHYLDVTNQLPIDDVDFMAAYEDSGDAQEGSESKQ